MALNMKLALGISLIYIAGMTWILDQVSRPTADLPSPLMARADVPRSEWLYATNTHRQTKPATALVASSPVTNAIAVALHDRQPSRRQQANLVLTARDALPPEGPQTSEHEIVRAADSAERRETTAAQFASTASETPVLLTNTAQAVEPDPVVHTVVAGDSLAKIAREYWGVDSTEAIDRLVHANPALKGRRHQIAVGEEIRIPEAIPQPRTAPFAPQTLPGGGTNVTLAAASGSHEDESLQWYTIRSRDSLSSIARRLLNDESRWVEIKRLNGIEDADVIRPGMRIKLPSPLARSDV